MDEHKEGRAERDDLEPHEGEIASGPVEFLAAPEPFTAIGAGIFDLVESVASEIQDVLSPEEARRRELQNVLKGRGVGRER